MEHQIEECDSGQVYKNQMSEYSRKNPKLNQEQSLAEHQFLVHELGTFLDQLQWQTSSSIFLAKYYSYNEAPRWHS